VKQSIRNLVLTNFYERPFNPTMAGNVLAILFENVGFETENKLKRYILGVIEIYEPRVKNVSVVSDFSVDNTIRVSITFTLINTTTPLTIDVVLNRIR